MKRHPLNLGSQLDNSGYCYNLQHQSLPLPFSSPKKTKTTTTADSMDVIFEPQRGKPFTIEVGFFDTVLEIKEKIQKYQGIPLQKQTLVFNGKILPDERDIESCEIFHNSHIQLLISSPEISQVKIEQYSSPTPSKKIQLNIKIPSSKTHVPLEMDVHDTILRLKEKIHEMEAVPINKLVLQSSSSGSQELLQSDDHSLHDCGLVDSTEITVTVQRPSPAGSRDQGSKKLRVMVLPKCGTKKIPVEVSASDNVGELKKELQNLHQKLQLPLPQEYFFIYKQNVMDDDRSFRWHHVNQGDTIEIFSGSVTGGSC